MDASPARKNRDCRQHPAIKSIFAAYDGGTRCLEDWVGNSSGAVNRGGRQAKVSQPADGERGAAAVDSAAARQRGRPRRPPPVLEDSRARPDSARGGSRPRQAPQGGRTLPPQHVQHNPAEQSGSPVASPAVASESREERLSKSPPILKIPWVQQTGRGRRTVLGRRQLRTSAAPREALQVRTRVQPTELREVAREDGEFLRTRVRSLPGFVFQHHERIANAEKPFHCLAEVQH